MIVIDASAVLEILKNSETGQELDGAIRGQTVEAPHVIDLEVANALRHWVIRREVTAADAQAALELFLQMRIRRHEHLPLMRDVWSLRHELTAYDAAYLALAWRLDAPLITTDEGLRKRAGRRRP